VDGEKVELRCPPWEGLPDWAHRRYLHRLRHLQHGQVLSFGATLASTTAGIYISASVVFLCEL
jgi:hypothetical protein